MAARDSRSRHGFTLIEILAVVLIIGLTFGFVLPNLDSSRSRRLEDRARDIANLVHVARQGAITSGAEHRLWFQLDEGTMRVDWYVTGKRADEAYGDSIEPPLAAAEEPSTTTAVSLFPPESEGRDYYPVASKYGENFSLPLDYWVVGVETPEGFIETGEVQLVFGRDGTTDYSEVLIADAWDNQLIVEVQPLMDRVRLRSPEEDAW
ncbi:prepilin-type N-terminal cleavage/methylation domain-containing protein [Myxococcota bacterium]|nr:prepilin-type N-terminal cleavage/methylation domain-containing protein [Myxococcota bacterium]